MNAGPKASASSDPLAFRRRFSTPAERFVQCDVVQLECIATPLLVGGTSVRRRGCTRHPRVGGLPDIDDGRDSLRHPWS